MAHMAGNDGAWYPISVPLPPVEVRKLKTDAAGGGNGCALTGGRGRELITA